MGKSALVTNIAENVALHPERPMPVALFSLEMSEGELAQRFVASQASIEGGRPPQGAASRTSASGRRSSKPRRATTPRPLFVDDSSDIGVLEIRAKARACTSRCRRTTAGLG
jgi:replicative DNA helicase